MKKVNQNKSNFPKSTGYLVPKSYFNTFDEKLLAKLHQKNQLNSTKASPFTVPNGYFETVEQQILSKTLNNKAKTPLLNKKVLFAALTGIAASLIFVLVIFNKPAEEAPITTAMVTEYLQNTNLSTFDLAQLLYEAEFLDEDAVIIKAEFSEDHLEDYLLENTNIETLLTQ